MAESSKDRTDSSYQRKQVEKDIEELDVSDDKWDKVKGGVPKQPDVGGTPK